ncbi:MAG TPA: DUF3552 domain-containing protein, partial [Acidobacteria bacterium]|nr:DUF3552 domain-containing protein [Acidobacteriota bacterium]
MITIPLWIIVAGIVVLAAGFLAVWVLWTRINRAGQQIASEAEKEARRVIAQAEVEAQRLLKDADVQARERLLAARTEFERETREHRVELAGIEKRLDQREMQLEERALSLGERERRVEELEESLKGRERELSRQEEELAAAVAEQRTRLEQIAGLTSDQARAELMHSMENEARMEAAGRIKRIEEEAAEKAKDRARRVISMAIQRIASEHVIESTVSVVDLPSDDMKGRIIGREGRNIRAFEQATGVDLIVDDTPEAVILSCFETVRREIARLALERLVQDGRIHPARIEEVVGKVQAEMDEKLLADGEAAALEAGIPDLHP